MSQDDEFRRIAAREFGEHWQPPAGPPDAPAEAAPGGDFHLNLYDDDESYRQVDPTAWQTGTLSRAGLIAIAAGVIVLILRLLTHGPTWLGWFSGAAVIAGLGLIIAQAVVSRHPGDDDDGTVV